MKVNNLLSLCTAKDLLRGVKARWIFNNSLSGFLDIDIDFGFRGGALFIAAEKLEGVGATRFSSADFTTLWTYFRYLFS